MFICPDIYWVKRLDQSWISDYYDQEHRSRLRERTRTTLEYPGTAWRTHLSLYLVMYGWFYSQFLVRFDPIDAGLSSDLLVT